MFFSRCLKLQRTENTRSRSRMSGWVWWRRWGNPLCSAGVVLSKGRWTAAVTKSSFSFLNIPNSCFILFSLQWFSPHLFSQFSNKWLLTGCFLYITPWMDVLCLQYLVFKIYFHITWKRQKGRENCQRFPVYFPDVRSGQCRPGWRQEEVQSPAGLPVSGLPTRHLSQWPRAGAL